MTFRILITALLCASLFACGSMPTKPKTTQLFNGKDLSGWSIQNDAQFSVEDGIIRINKGGGWLRSDKSYKDFILTLEVRYAEKEGNSGIFVRTGPTSHTNPEKNGWPDNGYQIQAKDTVEGVAFGNLIPYGAPPYEDAYDREALKKVYKPFGHWYKVAVKAVGEILEVRIDGELVTMATNIKNLEGHIGLQGDFGLVDYRNIEITEL